MKVVRQLILCLIFLVDYILSFILVEIIKNDFQWKRISRRKIQRETTLAVLAAENTNLGGLEPHSLTETLNSYSRQIRKLKQMDMKPVRSLKRYIDDNGDEVRIQSEDESELGDALSNVLIHSFRTCGNNGDYRMIISLLNAAVELCHSQPFLSPQVFGVALDALTQTGASINKVKNVWKLANSRSDILSEPIGAYELNIMLKVLGEKFQKVGAAINLYRSSGIVGDVFTASTVLNFLTNSICDDQEVSEEWIIDKSQKISPCWQFEEGSKILKSFVSQGTVNNFVFSSALNLNKRASQVFYQPGYRHNGAKEALDLMSIMKKSHVLPDVVTCSHILSTFDKHHEWKAAVTMLKSMEKTAGIDGANQSWHFPPPNVYCYSAAISACARCQKYDEAIRLLDRMYQGNVKPNTWVYNAVLSACASQAKKKRQQRIQMALLLLDKMKNSYDDRGNLIAAPDTVSYNTVLAAMGGIGKVFRDEKGHRIFEFSKTQLHSESWMYSETLVTEILKEMRNKGVPRDSLTYHNAIKASKSNSALIFQHLNEAVDDIGNMQNSLLTGRAGHGLSFVFNAALSTFAKRGDIDLFVQTFDLMKKTGVKANHESMLQFVVALGSSRNSKDVITLLHSLRGDQAASKALRKLYGIDFTLVLGLNAKELEELYAVSITSCLVSSDMENANAVLNMMKENGIAATESTMSEIAFTYTRMAVRAASRENKFRRKRLKRGLSANLGAEGEIAKSHAERAASIVNELDEPSPKLQSAVTSVLAVTENYENAKSMLIQLHNNAYEQKSSAILLSRRAQAIIDVLPGLHRSLLKICASYGNATSAFSFVEEIQSFSNSISSDRNETRISDTPLIADILDPKEQKNLTRILRNGPYPGEARKTGMKGEDWKLLLISASKSKDWKLSINTMQFLQPYLRATHPRWESNMDPNKLTRNYRKLARALTSLMLCLDSCKQDAWAVRAINDWIEWSGRRPPTQAVLMCVRMFAEAGRGVEVIRLIQEILKISPSKSDQREESQSSYGEIIYVGSLTHLHNNGLYEDADELYIQAMTQKHLTVSAPTIDRNGKRQLDLHGMNTAMAHSAVRTAFQQQVTELEYTGDLIIVTGRGLNSFYQMRPILRPEVQRMLTEEFYPPITTTSIPGNMGALRVPSQDIEAWTTHQRQQRDAKILNLATALKSKSESLATALKSRLEQSDNNSSSKS